MQPRDDGRCLRRGLALAVALAVTGPTFAGVYKCTDAKGRVAYQAAPCPQGAAAAVTIKESEPAPMPAEGEPAPVAAPAGSSPEEQSALLAKQAREADRNQRLRQISRSIADAETRIGDYHRAMDAEMARLRSEKARAMNNLAGATWDASLSAEMQAVAAKYDALIRVQQDRITRLRADEARVLEEK